VKSKQKLSEALRGLALWPAQGTAYRLTSPKYMTRPLSPEGSLQRGGRYNKRGRFAALYLADSPATALAEVQMLKFSDNRLIGIKGPPKVLVSWKPLRPGWRDDPRWDGRLTPPCGWPTGSREGPFLPPEDAHTKDTGVRRRPRAPYPARPAGAACGLAVSGCFPCRSKVLTASHSFRPRAARDWGTAGGSARRRAGVWCARTPPSGRSQPGR